VAYELRFTERHNYDSRPEGITIPALLSVGLKKIEVFGENRYWGQRLPV
jgi:hypothetical protein